MLDFVYPLDRDQDFHSRESRSLILRFKPEVQLFKLKCCRESAGAPDRPRISSPRRGLGGRTVSSSMPTSRAMLMRTNLRLNRERRVGRFLSANIRRKA